MPYSVDISEKISELEICQRESSSIQFIKQRNLAISPFNEKLNTLSRLLCKESETCTSLCCILNGRKKAMLLATNDRTPSEWSRKASKQIVDEIRLWFLKEKEIPLLSIVFHNALEKILEAYSGIDIDKKNKMKLFPFFDVMKEYIEKCSIAVDKGKKGENIDIVFFLKNIKNDFYVIKNELRCLSGKKRNMFLSPFLNIIEPIDDIFDLYNYFSTTTINDKEDCKKSKIMKGWQDIFCSKFDFLFVSEEKKECSKMICLKCKECISLLTTFSREKRYQVPRYKCGNAKLFACRICNACRYGELHAEMKILTYLVNNGIDKESLFIAASKLCCAPCDLQIKAINSIRPTNLPFQTSGVHSKIYIGWVVPEFSRKKLLDILDFSFERESTSFLLMETEREEIIQKWF